MALGIATVLKRSEADGPVRADVLSFAGDDAYAAGGTPDFTAYARAAVGRGQLTIVGVLLGECAGYVPVFDHAADKLKVYEAAADGGPLDEVAGSQAGVIYQVTILSV